MNHTTTEGTDSLQAALAMGSLGYKIVPIPPGEKYPKGLTEWQKKATDDEAQITDWWGKGERGIGWAMGRQPNGEYLVAIDVDVADGKVGKATIEALIKEHGLGSAFGGTTTQRTGTGGYHFVFSTDTDTITNGVLGQHVDIRGEGGFIVVAPSIHPNGQSYVWVKAPWDVSPSPLPLAIENLLVVEDLIPAPIVSRGTSLPFDGDDPIEWIKSQFSCADFVDRLGWQRGPTAGTQVKYTRPGKSVKEGFSAVHHTDEDIFNVFTTTLDPEFERWGHHSRSGVLTLNVFDLWSITNGFNSPSEAMSAIRKTLMPKREPGPGLHVPDPSSTASDSSPLNLSDEFWETRPVLEHIRTAAWSRLVSPDALLVGVLARAAALIPPSLLIPGMVGSSATFDFIGAVVAKSSGGKTVANSVAADLLPSSRHDILFDASPGSGEGLIAAFMGYEKDDKGRNTGDPSYKFGRYHAIHLHADEGSGLMEIAGRKGTTIAQTLCSAWSGAPLGQLNASLDTKRFVPAKKRRVSAVVNIQTSFGHQLLAEPMMHMGFPQRIVFAWAHAPRPPADTAWPGTLDMPQITVISTGNELMYDAQIVSEVREARLAVMDGSVVLDDLDGHQGLLRVKLAGIMCLLDGRDLVSAQDWSLAETILTSSRAVRQHLLLVHQQERQKADRDAGHRVAMREIETEDIKERQKIARLREAIVRKASEREWTRAPLRKAVCSGETRHRFEAALQAAVDDGAITIDDTGVIRGS
jgi:hypothetical protein